jgi:uncharacterized protein YndB with AHSA1/START domain
MTNTDLHGVDADFCRTLTINATPAAVRAAVTTGDGVSGWWMPAVAEDPQVLTVSFGDSTAEFRVTAAPELVVWDVLSCAVEPDWVGTSIEFATTAKSAGTIELAFTHRGLGALPCAETCFAGWTHFLPSLVSYLESGVGNPGRRQA